jgi:TM2 domain-containing membrane protein YozV
MKAINSEKYTLTLLMWLFFGIFGVHRFINNKIGTGLLMLFTFGGFGIWYIVDMILILTNNFKNKNAEIVGYEGNFFKKPVNIIILVWFGFLLIFALGSEPVPADTAVPVSTPVAVSTPAPATTSTPASTPSESTMTMGQKNAIKKAESYIKIKGFSKEALISQLEFEGYTTEDATWASDNVTVDWNEEAKQSAESYVDIMAMSASGLYDQLIFEGYTDEQANYGVSAVGY